MNRNDLRKVDLQLLVVFESLMHERNLTRTAEKLYLGQPAIRASPVSYTHLTLPTILLV